MKRSRNKSKFVPELTKEFLNFVLIFKRWSTANFNQIKEPIILVGFFALM